jgi:hypothetical protein
MNYNINDIVLVLLIRIDLVLCKRIILIVHDLHVDHFLAYLLLRNPHLERIVHEDESHDNPVDSD